MDWIYSCPHCDAILNAEDSIVVRGEHDGRQLVIGLHPQPGNYEVDLPPGETMVPGTRWRFRCPACGHDLTSELSDDLCALDMWSGADRHRVYFSRIAGEEATFVVGAEGLLDDHGIHTDRYVEHLIHRKYMR